MARAKRVCGKPGCPKVTDVRLCLTHQAEAEKTRGTTNQRGYGANHQRTRTTLDIRVQAGLIDCARCGQRIKPDQPWHLDHDDEDRSKYLGPSHAHCNTRAAGTKSQS